MGDMHLEISGKPVRLRETLTKDGKRTYWAARLPDKGVSPYGIAVAALSTTLPDTVRIGEMKGDKLVPFHTFQLEHGTTPNENKEGKKLTPRKRVTSDEHFQMPDGSTKQLHLSISEKSYGAGWQIKASVTRSVSPEERAANRAENEKKRAEANLADILA